MKKAGVSMIMVTAGAMGSFLLGLPPNQPADFPADQRSEDRPRISHGGRILSQLGRADRTGSFALYGGKEPVYHYCIKSEEFEVDEEGYTVLKNRMDGLFTMVKLYYAPRADCCYRLNPEFQLGVYESGRFAADGFRLLIYSLTWPGWCKLSTCFCCRE